MKWKTAPVFLAFVAMGFVDAVGPFFSLARAEFHLSSSVAALIPFVGLSMFGLLSIPTGLFQNRLGKKFILLSGLCLALVGVLNASFGLDSFPRFLITIVLLGAGSAVLQVAGNPLMCIVSPKGKSARNLSLAQFFKAIGSLSGPIIPVLAVRYFGLKWTAIFPVYSVALLIFLVAAGSLDVSKERAQGNPTSIRSCIALLRNPLVFAMTLAIFLYVGAEVTLSAAIPLFLQERFGLDIGRVGLLGTGLFFTALTVGRFCGGMILNWMQPARFLVCTCMVALLGLCGLFVPSSGVAAAGFFLAGLGFANIFPLIFSSTVEYLPERNDEISGLLVTAIVGGAVLPIVFGALADHAGVLTALLVPVCAILYVQVLAFVQQRRAILP
jgi:fucose permease